MDGRHVDIGGRRLYLEIMGEGTPTVVFESGSECGRSSSCAGHTASATPARFYARRPTSVTPVITSP